jgi:predicted dinucleotide-binding enzyme
MKIGAIGSGHIGSTIGSLWVKAGHEVVFSPRRPEALGDLISGLGSRARAGTPGEVAAFGEIAFFAVPFGAWPDLANTLARLLRGKVVIDAANPFAERDGAIIERVRSSNRGSGAFVAELLPASRVVKAFNTLYYATLKKKAGREGERLAIPVAGNDAEAVAQAARLVRDAGFETVTLSSIERARGFDAGTPVYNQSKSASALRKTLGIPAYGAKDLDCPIRGWTTEGALS